MKKGSPQLLNVQGVTFSSQDPNWAPNDFEQFVHGSLSEEIAYSGTSPRKQKSGRVFTASEINAQYPVPIHCEMAFLPKYPKEIHFYCKRAAVQGGETPLVDFRKVYADLPEEFRKRLHEKDVRYHRLYRSSRTKQRFNPAQLKTWEDLFGTNDKSEVEKQCRELDQQFHWGKNNSLTISETRPAFRFLEDQATWTYFCQIASFHPFAVIAEARKLFLRKKSFGSFRIYLAGIIFLGWRYRFSKPQSLAMYCSFGDGTKFTRREMNIVQDTIWKHAEYIRLKAGDVLSLDNRFVAHGRFPFRGEREIWVTWK